MPDAGKDTFLGIEIGGTKLQLGIGTGGGSPLIEFERRDVDPSRGAGGILQQIERTAAGLLEKHRVSRIGVGFGGPVNRSTGCVVKSHQIDGWEGFPLAPWCRETLGVPTVLGNDCDLATLAEACYGGGRDHRTVFFVTVGTGVGGGLVHDQLLFGAHRPAIAEIGHLRPGLHADRPDATVEGLASGVAIAAAAQARVSGNVSRPIQPLLTRTGSIDARPLREKLEGVVEADAEYTADLLERCGGKADALTAKIVAEAAADGNQIAQELLEDACRALGWAIAQVITLVAPEVVVVGGGVSLIGEQFFFAPLREQVQRYVFPPLAGSYEILPAALGELVVVHGALALAAMAETG